MHSFESIGLFCSAWSKSKSKDQNFGFGRKQNTKETLEPPPITTHNPPKTFKEVPGKLEACEDTKLGLIKLKMINEGEGNPG